MLREQQVHMGRAVTEAKRRKRQNTWTSSNTQLELLPPNPANLSRAETISRYHTLKKQLALVDKSPLLPNEASREARRHLLRAQLKLIGIEKYQTASREGEAIGGGFDSSQWVIHILLQGEHELFARNRPLIILDVGAIAHRFPEQLDVGSNDKGSAEIAGCAAVPLHVTSIDLNPEDSEAGKRVIRVDFFEFAKAGLRGGGGQYDMVCLSLCVNFEGSAPRRGLMMHLAARLLNKGGLLFVVLPRACVENSRYFDEVLFRKIVSATGMDVVTLKYSRKLMQSVLKRVGDEQVNGNCWKLLSKKKLVREGKNRNNFTICLDEASLKECENETEEQTNAGPSVEPIPKASEEAPRDVLEEMRRRKKRKRAKAKGSRIEKPTNASNRRKKIRRQKKREHKISSGRAANVRTADE